MTAPPGVFVTRRDRCYRVAGTTAHHLMEATTLMCPHRAGALHAGYTDWKIAWSFVARERDGSRAVAAARVEVVVTCTVPRWRPPRAAHRALVAAWDDYVAAILKHERGHADIAVSGAGSLHDAVMAVEPCRTLEELDLRVADVAEAALRAIRATDQTYDDATEHGALQGVRLPW